MSSKRPVVKGSKQSPLRLTPHRPYRKLLLKVLGLALVVAAAFTGYLTGRWTGYTDWAKAQSGQEHLQAKLNQLEEMNQALRKELALQRVGSDVGEKIQEQIRFGNKQLQDRISELEEIVAFYRNVMDPKNSGSGIRIERLSVEETGESNRFRYRLIVTQGGNQQRYVSGKVYIKIEGVSQGQQLTLGLKDVQDGVKQNALKFRFKYFQDFTGEWHLPEAFVPRLVDVHLKSSRGRSRDIRQQIDWQEVERGE